MSFPDTQVICFRDDYALPSLIAGHMRGRKGWLITYHLLHSTPDQATGLSRKHN